MAAASQCTTFPEISLANFKKILDVKECKDFFLNLKDKGDMKDVLILTGVPAFIVALVREQKKDSYLSRLVGHGVTETKRISPRDLKPEASPPVAASVKTGRGVVADVKPRRSVAEKINAGCMNLYKSLIELCKRKKMMPRRNVLIQKLNEIDLKDIPAGLKCVGGSSKSRSVINLDIFFRKIVELGLTVPIGPIEAQVFWPGIPAVEFECGDNLNPVDRFTSREKTEALKFLKENQDELKEYKKGRYGIVLFMLDNAPASIREKEEGYLIEFVQILINRKYLVFRKGNVDYVEGSYESWMKSIENTDGGEEKSVSEKEFKIPEKMLAKMCYDNTFATSVGEIIYYPIYHFEKMGPQHGPTFVCEIMLEPREKKKCRLVDQYPFITDDNLLENPFGNKFFSVDNHCILKFCSKRCSKKTAAYDNALESVMNNMVWEEKNIKSGSIIVDLYLCGKADEPKNDLGKLKINKEEIKKLQGKNKYEKVSGIRNSPKLTLDRLLMRIDQAVMVYSVSCEKGKKSGVVWSCDVGYKVRVSGDDLIYEIDPNIYKVGDWRCSKSKEEKDDCVNDVADYFISKIVPFLKFKKPREVVIPSPPGPAALPVSSSGYVSRVPRSLARLMKSVVESNHNYDLVSNFVPAPRGVHTHPAVGSAEMPSRVEETESDFFDGLGMSTFSHPFSHALPETKDDMYSGYDGLAMDANRNDSFFHVFESSYSSHEALEQQGYRFDRSPTAAPRGAPPGLSAARSAPRGLSASGAPPGSSARGVPPGLSPKGVSARGPPSGISARGPPSGISARGPPAGLSERGGQESYYNWR
ncbi:MAG: hypothetical protein Hyperionvirus3_117 [Hyperionvirus sp.]|uniref:Uncharacterized protein n=1 Tax=Hyperionvirus sp. TaxID=2487770 RepID=A0A3G5A9V1_9VIRU|nr:MAG: hypothetical protein Hyperionvirus3_117 [Hyperionvirus sp.]